MGRGGGRGTGWEKEAGFRAPSFAASHWCLLKESQGLLSALLSHEMPLRLLQYDQPFEDGPVVQMSTLTYETPQGTSQAPFLNIYGSECN